MPPTAASVNRKHLPRPDTYQAAADLCGWTVGHAYHVLHGKRQTSATKRARLRQWARDLSAQGSASAAVVAALDHLN